MYTCLVEVNSLSLSGELSFLLPLYRLGGDGAGSTIIHLLPYRQGKSSRNFLFAGTMKTPSERESRRDTHTADFTPVVFIVATRDHARVCEGGYVRHLAV